MGSFSRSSRGRRHGKLTNVLDHQLRIGDEDVSESIIEAYKQRGLQPPDHLEAPPEIRPEFVLYWEAYRDLISERRTPRGPIPALAIIHYADAYGLDRDELKRIVWAVDRVLLDHWKELDKAEEAKRKAKTTQPTIGSSK